MGLILDSSIFIAAGRGKFDLAKFFQRYSGLKPVISAITASELLHGVERADNPERKSRRSRHVEQIVSSIHIMSFDLTQARCHAKIWAELDAKGTLIGAHDLQIAAACLVGEHNLATLNKAEFQRVPGLNLVDTIPFVI